MFNQENVTVTVDGSPFTMVERVQVSASMKSATRKFSLTIAERPGEWNIPAGSAVEIKSNSDLLVSGYSNRYQSSGSPTSHKVTIKGRGKGQDFVDSSATHPTGYFEKQTPDKAAKEIDKHGAGITSKVALASEDYMQFYQGETAFSFIERWLRGQGVTQMGKADGSIEITNASVAQLHAGYLREGLNIAEYSVEQKDDHRHSHYIVKGQSRHGTGGTALQIVAQAIDPAVTRFRPKIIVAEQNTDQKRAQRRADHERERAAGEAMSGSVKTQSFRDIMGQLYEPNRLIYVHAPVLMHLSQAMLIESLTFDWTPGGGSETELKIVDPRAHQGKPGRTGGSGAAKTSKNWTAGW
jgi:prophage tail gpP-like protein